ncbi:aldose 1-epimerase family protein [Deminuibacter soli]|uniref:Aldose 1-epimerase family protein n=1 Tax=Deminuibacter soli TaxID=2291815 RepID=A0A3E1NPE3_9BACT|nr:aldose 1-epimerase family protein [Deminuibacter soli]RFM29809.1 aldose 1-epimerase family protein [Deminuibacter soli]
MIHLENELLKVSIAEKGAELQSIIRKDNGLEYMWSGDATFWGKKSPVLFPIVGGLKNNAYTHNGKTYPLGRHGFARDKVFTVSAQTANTIAFTLESTADTLQVYPFTFRFTVQYQLNNASLLVTYKVENTGNENLLFSVGGHPAFKVPLTDGGSYEDYYLQFDTAETAGRWPLSDEGLIKTATEPLLENTDTLPLNKPLFYGDALVLKHLQSKSVTLKSKTHAHGLRFHFDGFPFLGIWSAKNADFVCIEPWCGIADSITTTGRLEDKEGIETLAPQGSFAKTWSVDLF